MLGIPAGVKMYSGVFAIDPLLRQRTCLTGNLRHFRTRRSWTWMKKRTVPGSLTTRLFGIARVPVLAGMVQVSKQVFEEADEERAKDEIARFIQEVMLPDTLYILGAGTTTEAIARNLGVPKTLLGVDVIKDGSDCCASDANEKTLLDLVEGEKDITDHHQSYRGPGFYPRPGKPADQRGDREESGTTEYYRGCHAAQAAGDAGTAGGYRGSGTRPGVRGINPGNLRLPDRPAQTDRQMS